MVYTTEFEVAVEDVTGGGGGGICTSGQFAFFGDCLPCLWWCGGSIFGACCACGGDGGGGVGE